MPSHTPQTIAAINARTTRTIKINAANPIVIHLQAGRTAPLLSGAARGFH